MGRNWVLAWVGSGEGNDGSGQEIFARGLELLNNYALAFNGVVVFFSGEFQGAGCLTAKLQLRTRLSLRISRIGVNHKHCHPGCQIPPGQCPVSGVISGTVLCG